MTTYKTAESVCMGHPDKLCDLIADSILDACLRKDKSARVACEVMATKGKIVVAGEITCDGKVDIRWEVREVLRKVGYNPWKFTVFVFVHKQSADISAGVTTALEARNGSEERYASIGAGDQGTVYGYATNETREMLPLPLVLAHRICKRVDTVRKDKIVKGILPDGKAQVSVEYEDGKPKRISAVVVSAQHSAEVGIDALRDAILEQVIFPVLPPELLDEHTEYFINPTGRFVVGGPAGDSGLTGRKIIADTYGGMARHGGGAFSGKDPSKVDRTGAYMARYLAKNIVAAELADRCEIELAYAIGLADPVSVMVDTFGTGRVSDEKIASWLMEHIDMRPGSITSRFELRRPIYRRVSCGGHFGENAVGLPWEWTDIAEVLQKEILS